MQHTSLQELGLHPVVLCCPMCFRLAAHPHSQCFWGHAATARETSCEHFGQALCSVIALIATLQSYKHHISGQQKIRGSSQAASAPVFCPTNRPSGGSPSLLSYCSKQYSIPTRRSGKGQEKGVVCFGN